jgi:hypothetical protein
LSTRARTKRNAGAWKFFPPRANNSNNGLFRFVGRALLQPDSIAAVSSGEAHLPSSSLSDAAASSVGCPAKLSFLALSKCGGVLLRGLQLDRQQASPLLSRVACVLCVVGSCGWLVGDLTWVLISLDECVLVLCDACGFLVLLCLVSKRALSWASAVLCLFVSLLSIGALRGACRNGCLGLLRLWVLSFLKLLCRRGGGRLNVRPGRSPSRGLLNIN